MAVDSTIWSAEKTYILSDFPHEALEGKLPEEELGRLLVLPDLAERDGTGPEPVRLLHASSEGALLGRLGSHLAGGLATGRLTGSLLGTGHLELMLLWNGREMDGNGRRRSSVVWSGRWKLAEKEGRHQRLFCSLRGITPLVGPVFPVLHSNRIP